MLKHIISIKNVGKFKDYARAGNWQFGKATVVYAPNARGKTTLCDVFRSLKTGESSFVEGRATLSSRESPTIEILTDQGVVRYKNGWSATLPRIEIFDSKFIYENVYAGECVEHNQRKGLYDVIVGEEGVRLKKQVEVRDEVSRDATRNEKEVESELQSFLKKSSFSVPGFVALEPDANIDAKILSARQTVAALTAVSELGNKALLAELQSAYLPVDIKPILAKTIDGLLDDAASTVRLHVKTRMAEADEPWLIRGLDLVKGDACPFCEQSIDGRALIRAYRDHFSGKYEELKREIASTARQIDAFASGDALLKLQRTIGANAALLLEWRSYVPTPDIGSIDGVSLGVVTAALRREATTLLTVKSSTPMEPVAVTEDFNIAERAAAEANGGVERYNVTVQLINSVLQAKRGSLDSAQLPKARRDLADLEAMKLRFEPEAVEAVNRYHSAIQQRKDSARLKQESRDALDLYSRDIFQRYQTRINELLGNFGASFTLKNTGERYAGGKPSSTYSIVIDGSEVEIGDSNSAVSEPSFRNTLSAGDKSALALAFFIAKIDASQTVAETIVVFDDPFTSQDSARQTCTQQEIARLSRDAKQVIVLSHDRRFLKRIWDSLGSSSRQSLQLSPLGDTKVTGWDVESVQDEYVQMYTTLWKYCNHFEGDPQLVIRTIRPLLEGYLRMKLPRDFKESEWLGDYVNQIRDATPGTTVGEAKGILKELTDIKNYSKRHHHYPGSDAPEEAVDSTEVLAWGKRTLTLVHAF